jgi:hypothetical protein
MKQDLVDKVMYFSPRILSILFILFLSLFALDSSSLIGLMMHLIPSFLIIVVLIVVPYRVSVPL